MAAPHTDPGIIRNKPVEPATTPDPTAPYRPSRLRVISGAVFLSWLGAAIGMIAMGGIGAGGRGLSLMALIPAVLGITAVLASLISLMLYTYQDRNRRRRAGLFE